MIAMANEKRTVDGMKEEQASAERIVETFLNRRYDITFVMDDVKVVAALGLEKANMLRFCQAMYFSSAVRRQRAKTGSQEFYLTTKTIREKTGQQKESVIRRVMKALGKDGLLTVEMKKVQGTKQYKRRVVTLNWDRYLELIEVGERVRREAWEAEKADRDKVEEWDERQADELESKRKAEELKARQAAEWPRDEGWDEEEPEEEEDDDDDDDDDDEEVTGERVREVDEDPEYGKETVTVSELLRLSGVEVNRGNGRRR